MLGITSALLAILFAVAAFETGVGALFACSALMASISALVTACYYYDQKLEKSYNERLMKAYEDEQTAQLDRKLSLDTERRIEQLINQEVWK